LLLGREEGKGLDDRRFFVRLIVGLWPSGRQSGQIVALGHVRFVVRA
jgi:hypothetical protein